MAWLGEFPWKNVQICLGKVEEMGGEAELVD